MRRRAPVDEERHEAVGQHRARVREAPGERHAVGTAPATGSDIAEDHAVSCGVTHQLFQVRSLGGPCHKPWSLQIVDSEASRCRWLRLIRIRSDDLEVACGTERHERVASASTRVLTARRRSDTEQRLDARDTSAQVGCCVNEMVDLRKNHGGRGCEGGAEAGHYPDRDQANQGHEQCDRCLSKHCAPHYTLSAYDPREESESSSAAAGARGVDPHAPYLM